MSRTVKSLRFHSICKLIRQTATVSKMLAEYMRHLGQRWRTYIRYSRHHEVHVCFGPSSCSVPYSNAQWLRCMLHMQWVCVTPEKIQVRKSFIRELLTNMPSCSPGVKHYLPRSHSGQQQTTLPFTLKGDKHICKDSTEQKLSLAPCT